MLDVNSLEQYPKRAIGINSDVRGHNCGCVMSAEVNSLVLCRGEGCYLNLGDQAHTDICPRCAMTERRRTVRKRNERIEQGTQWQLGIRMPGRWCKDGCCDLDNPQTGDCRI